MRNRWRILFITVLSILLTFGLVICAEASSEIQVTVDNQQVDFPDQKPFINNDNRTMVPVRAPMEALHATVMWSEQTRKATINLNGRIVVFTIGSKAYTVQGKVQTMDTAAVIEGGRTAFPIRFAAEALGATVVWEANTRTVKIYSKVPDKTNVIGAKEIDRLRSYKNSGAIKTPMSEYARTNPEIADYVLKQCTSVLQLEANQRFISDKELIYASSDTVRIRGILQTLNTDGSATEQDMDYGLYITVDGNGRPSMENRVDKEILGEPCITK